MARIPIKKALLAAAALLALAQLVRPERTNPPTDASRTLAARVPTPAPVSAILARACADCHSNETVWPWYSGVAPVSWLIASDVRKGRDHDNFSDWAAHQSKEEERDHLVRLCGLVREGEMPPAPYLLMHPRARLSAEDVEALCAWVKAVAGEGPASRPVEN